MNCHEGYDQPCGSRCTYPSCKESRHLSCPPDDQESSDGPPIAAPLKRRFRRNWRGKLILQVCEVRHYMHDLRGTGYYDEGSREVWRDAKLSDVTEGVV